MYIRLSCTLLLATVLSGCQQTLPKVLKPVKCSLSTQQLAGLIRLEAEYHHASTTNRRILRQQAIKDKEHLQAALLLSASDASEAQLKQALSYYNRARKTPPGCDSDDYLTLRLVQTRARLQQYEQAAELNRQAEQLQQKIDALTGLENELSGQRGLPR